MIAVTNVGTGAIMLMTAIVLAKEAVAAGPVLVHAHDPGLDPVGAVTALIPVAVAGAAADLLLIPAVGAGLAPQLVPGLLQEVDPGLALVLALLLGAHFPALAPDLRQPITKEQGKNLQSICFVRLKLF